MLSRSSVRAVVAAMAILVAAAFNNHALGDAWVPGDLITYPQGMWSDDPTATGLLFNNYDSIYSASFGIVEAGIPGPAGFSIQFGSASYVIGYLPASGTLGPLIADYNNPTSTSSGGLGGEVLTLRLNIDFSDAGITLGALGIPFGDLEFYNLSALPLLNGLTVRQVSAEANTLLGGGSGIYSIAQLGGVTSELNSSFGAGGVSVFAMDHLRVVPGIPGDYNNNGVVDAADYTVWRNTLGQSGTGLAADGNGSGTIDPGDYAIWKTHFGDVPPGNGAGSGSGFLSTMPTATVPEPSAYCLILLVLMSGVGALGGRMDWPHANRSDR